MKTSLLTFLAIIICNALSAQDISERMVPSVVLNTFNVAYPTAIDVDWEQKGKFYEVEFELDWNMDHEIWYNEEGKVIKHKEDVAVDTLPQKVKTKIKENYRAYSIDDLHKITTDKEVVYSMDLNSFLQQDWEIVINEKGEILNKLAD